MQFNLHSPRISFDAELVKHWGVAVFFVLCLVVEIAACC